MTELPGSLRGFTCVSPYPPSPMPFSFQLLVMGALPSFPWGVAWLFIVRGSHLDWSSISNGHILPRTAQPPEDAEALFPGDIAVSTQEGKVS